MTRGFGLWVGELGVSAQPAADLGSVFEQLRQRGLLLRSDFELLSVASLVAGEQIRGSWWSHPLGNEIHSIAEQLAAHPDVVTAKLVSGKDTFVHRELWDALIAIGTVGEPWQVEGLTRPARALLSRVDRMGTLRLDNLGKGFGFTSVSPDGLGRELERRLLVLGQLVRSEAGSNVRQLVSWAVWAREEKLSASRAGVAQAKSQIEAIVRSFGEGSRGPGQLPWHRNRWRSSEPKTRPVSP